MNRRNLLQWFCCAIATACAAIVVIPGFQFVFGPIMRRKPKKTLVQRIAQLDQLKLNQPQLFPIIGERRDAWTLYSGEVLARVWLVRRTDEKTTPQETKVDAYSAECPHLGCTVVMGSSNKDFFCPCHKAAFDFSGQTFSEEQLGYQNPAPRSMDSLVCKVIEDKKKKQWWVEVELQRFKIGTAEKTPI